MKLQDLSVYIIKRCPHKSEELKEKKGKKDINPNYLKKRKTYKPHKTSS